MRGNPMRTSARTTKEYSSYSAGAVPPRARNIAHRRCTHTFAEFFFFYSNVKRERNVYGLVSLSLIGRYY
jgi:hypothetical protein